VVVVGAPTKTIGANSYQGSAYAASPEGTFYVIPKRKGGGAVIYLE
jgi:hypothetical protein